MMYLGSRTVCRVLLYRRNRGPSYSRCGRPSLGRLSHTVTYRIDTVVYEIVRLYLNETDPLVSFGKVCVEYSVNDYLPFTPRFPSLVLNPL